MLLFTENAPMESIRLSKAGYQVAVNKTMNNRWNKALGEIDGAIIYDNALERNNCYGNSVMSHKIYKLFI